MIADALLHPVVDARGVRYGEVNEDKPDTRILNQFFGVTHNADVIIDMGPGKLVRGSMDQVIDRAMKGHHHRWIFGDRVIRRETACQVCAEWFGKHPDATIQYMR